MQISTRFVQKCLTIKKYLKSFFLKPRYSFVLSSSYRYVIPNYVFELKLYREGLLKLKLIKLLLLFWFKEYLKFTLYRYILSLHFLFSKYDSTERAWWLQQQTTDSCITWRDCIPILRVTLHTNQSGRGLCLYKSSCLILLEIKTLNNKLMNCREVWRNFNVSETAKIVLKIIYVSVTLPYMRKNIEFKMNNRKFYVTSLRWE